MMKVHGYTKDDHQSIGGLGGQVSRYQVLIAIPAASLYLNGLSASAFTQSEGIAFQAQASPSPVSEISNGQLELGIGVLVLGLLVTLLFGAFLGYALKNFYDTFRATVQPGQIETEALDPIVHAQGITTEVVTGINIDGPPNIQVGVAAAFRVTRADGSSPVEVEWTARPAEAAGIEGKGATADVQANKVGQFRIIAKVKELQGDKPATLVATATVQAKPRESGARRASLPFVGRGYVTLLVLPLLLTVVALLGITGALNGEALAAFTSAIGGFLFGHAAASGGGAPSQGSEQS